MSSGFIYMMETIDLLRGFFVLILSLLVLGCSVGRHSYKNIDTDTRWIRTIGDYQEFRFESDQWVRITCWYHQFVSSHN